MSAGLSGVRVRRQGEGAPRQQKGGNRRRLRNRGKSEVKMRKTAVHRKNITEETDMADKITYEPITFKRISLEQTPVDTPAKAKKTQPFLCKNRRTPVVLKPPPHPRTLLSMNVLPLSSLWHILCPICTPSVSIFSLPLHGAHPSLPCVRGGGAAKPRRRGCQACRIYPHFLQSVTANRQPLSQPNG